MRIIAGEFRGRKLVSVKNAPIRPTSDKVRESIFNILSEKIRDRVVLDLFAGTGALGIEALSRGASFVYFVDKSKKSLSILQKNIRLCRAEKRSKIIRWDISKGPGFLKSVGMPLDFVFMDPPYDRNLIEFSLKMLIANNPFADNPIIIVEHSMIESMPEASSEWNILDFRKYGKTLVSILEPVL